MKKFLFAFALLGLTSFAVQAQTCCSKAGKNASNAKSEASCHESDAASTAASLDDSIEKRVDGTTGKVTFVRRSVDANSGQATYIPVEYNTETKRFVNQSPETKAECVKEGKTSACCANGSSGQGGTCCTKESSSKTSATSVKLIKSQN